MKKKIRTSPVTGKLEPLPMAPPAEDEATPVAASVSAQNLGQVEVCRACARGEPCAHHPDHAAAAEAKRVEAWDLAAAPEFGDLILLPWSHERHSLCARLIAADVPAQPLSELARLQAVVASTQGLADVELSRYVDLTPYLPTAEKVLYLASHEPHEFAHVRSSLSRFFGEIADWAAENIPHDMQEQACLAAHRIIIQHEAVMAMPAPRRGGRASLKN